MKKLLVFSFTLLLLCNLILIFVTYQQHITLQKYDHLLTNLEGKIEDIDDSIEEEIIPLLKSR